MLRILFGATIAATTLFAGSAMASEKCDVPEAEWKTVEALEQKLQSDGWTVERIKTEDGCYEAYALDDQGRHVEAYFDPKKFETVEMEVKG
jgi:hypothetical protein